VTNARPRDRSKAALEASVAEIVTELAELMIAPVGGDRDASIGGMIASVKAPARGKSKLAKVAKAKPVAKAKAQPKVKKGPTALLPTVRSYPLIGVDRAKSRIDPRV
jgi:hypothetical protein